MHGTQPGQATVESRTQYKRAALRDHIMWRCNIKHCHCSCHSSKAVVSLGFWTVKHTPLSAILWDCDQSRCGARRYQLSVCVQLLWLGIPFALSVGGEFITGTSGYSLRPSLQIQRVVENTSLGLEALERLRHWCFLIPIFEEGTRNYAVKDAKITFRELHRSDPTFRTHVNSQGHTYLQELIHWGAWDCDAFRFSGQLEILSLRTFR